MIPEQIGDGVKIGNLFVPAVNIQVEDIPEGYGLYFEILFEDASLWEINQPVQDDWRGLISVTEYPKWGLTQDLSNPGVTMTLADWDEFLGLYNEKRRVRDWRI